MGSFFTTAFLAFSDSSFELQAVKKVTNKMANTKYLNVFWFVRYGGYSPQLSNSSFVHNSGKNILFWYFGNMYFFQSLPPVAS